MQRVTYEEILRNFFWDLTPYIYENEKEAMMVLVLLCDVTTMIVVWDKLFTQQNSQTALQNKIKYW